MPDMTDARCAWCRRRLPAPRGTGRPRVYCRRSCRQRAFEARRRLGELSWGEGRLQELIERQDQLHVVVESLGDLVGELRADVEDGQRWDDGQRMDVLERLEALVRDLRAATNARNPERSDR
jgi:hypothetical protein